MSATWSRATFSSVPVPRTDYTVTLAGKIAGALLPNPHRLVEEYPADLIASAVSRAVEEGRSYRPYFPLGAPDRD